MKSFYITIILLFTLIIAFAQNYNLALLGQLPYNAELSDIWGYESEGKEYALVGVFDAFSIVDVTDAKNPVEVDNIRGPGSTWRDIKTWDHYAYVTNETGEGCVIVDLQYLPDSTVTYNFTGEGGENFTTAHNVFIDEFGIMYIIGSNNDNAGCLMYDLNEDPTNPKFVGEYKSTYVHDIYVRDNILYTCEPSESEFAIVDVSDKSNPKTLGKANTNGTTHNCWPSDDGNILFTTDENEGLWVISWDISDPSDIKELDRWLSSPGQGVIPHNAFVRGDYTITSYYTDGVIITNVEDPANMAQVGRYDTSANSGGGFSGCWGVYPYLSSGNIIASDMQEGLFVLKPEYKGAAFMNGLVLNAETSEPISDATIKIINQTLISDSNGVFEYKGAYEETFTITVTKFGFDDVILTDVELKPGETIEITVELKQQNRIYNITGNLFDADDNNKLDQGAVIFSIGDSQFEYVAENGDFKIDSIYAGKYNVTIGSWGYLPVEIELNATQSNQVLNLYLNKGIYDDFALDYGWSKETNSSSGGEWQLVDPIAYFQYGYQFTLENDVDSDIGNRCYVTGNEELFSFVGSGINKLFSPIFDMSQMENPYINFHSYIVNISNNGLQNNTVDFKLRNGTDEITVHVDRNGDVQGTQWNFHNYSIKDQIDLTETMQFSIHANGTSNQVLLESGFDVFQVIDSAAVSVAANSVLIDDNMGTVTEASTDNTFNITENDIVTCDNPQYYLVSYNEQFFNNAKIDNGVLSFDVPNFSAYGDYQITYGINCGGTDNSVANVFVTIGEVTGINEAVQNNLQLSPNPANDFIYVDGLTHSSTQINYKLYDISGQLITTKYLNSSSKINLKDFGAGVYIAKFYVDDEILSVNKIIKK